jgi:hypothetical protein
MKNVYILILLLAFSLSANAAVGTWTGKASLPFKRSSCVGFSLDGKGYSCAGLDSVLKDQKDLWQYDPVNNTWSQKADLPGLARRELSAFTIGDYAYVGHGRNLNSTEIFYSFYKYDASSNTWSAIADCPVKRYTSTGFSIDSIGYVCCGIVPGVSRYKDLYAYNPRTNSWSQKASLPSAALNRSYATCVSLNHKAYLMGGFEGQYMKDFYEYDPIQNTWTQKADFGGGLRNGGAGFALHGYVMMGLGGDATTTVYKDWYYYNPSNNTWTQMNSYPSDNKRQQAVFVIGNTGYICGGDDGKGNIMAYVNAFDASALSIGKASSRLKLTAFHPQGGNTICANAYPGDLSIWVYDLSGKLVFTEKRNVADAGQQSFELEALSKGMYVAELMNGRYATTLKVLID